MAGFLSQSWILGSSGGGVAFTRFWAFHAHSGRLSAKSQSKEHAASAQRVFRVAERCEAVSVEGGPRDSWGGKAEN